MQYDFKGIFLKCDITLQLRNDPSALLIVPAGKVFCVDQTVQPQVVEGGMTQLIDMLPVQYRASGWPNKVLPIAAWVSKARLDEAITYSAEASPVL